MQLRTARVCLDCEELHEDQRCPVCESEAFAQVTRWVPAEERRTLRRPAAATANSETSSLARWTKRGAIGLAVIAASRWLWRASQPAQDDAKPQGREETTGSRGI